MPRKHIRAWMRAGLIEPVRIEHGVWHFDFAQVSAAMSILEVLKQPYVIPTLRRRLLRLKAWLPEMNQSLSQLAAVERHGSLLLRLADGDLAGDDGQLQFEFERDAHAPTEPILRISSGPSTASEWHEQGVQQEREGHLKEAVASYRDALLAGGPNVQMRLT